MRKGELERAREKDRKRIEELEHANRQLATPTPNPIHPVAGSMAQSPEVNNNT